MPPSTKTGPGAFGMWSQRRSPTSVYFALVPPVLAVGLYPCLWHAPWHAPRHVARLALLGKESAKSLASGRVAPALRRFARDAAPLTLVAVASLAALYLMAPGAGASPPALLALYLVLISALTLPHVVVVSFMDYRQGLYSGQPSAVSKSRETGAPRGKDSQPALRVPRVHPGAAVRRASGLQRRDLFWRGTHRNDRCPDHGRGHRKHLAGSPGQRHRASHRGGYPGAGAAALRRGRRVRRG